MKRMLGSTVVIGLLTVVFMLSIKTVSNDFMTYGYVGLVSLISMCIGLFLNILFYIDDKNNLELNNK